MLVYGSWHPLEGTLSGVLYRQSCLRCCRILGGSWALRSRAFSRVTMATARVRFLLLLFFTLIKILLILLIVLLLLLLLLLIALLISTHDPPSIVSDAREVMRRIPARHRREMPRMYCASL